MHVLFILDLGKVFMVPLLIGHCRLYIVGSLKITFTVPLTGNCLQIYLTREMNQFLSPQRLTSLPINLNINLQPITILLCWPIPRLLNLTPWELWTSWREKPRPRPRQLRREYHQASSRLCQVNILNSILGFLFFLSQWIEDKLKL